MSNVVASIVEDIIAVSSILAAMLLPALVFVIIGIGLFISALVLPRIYKFFREVGRSIKRLFSFAT